MKNEATSYYYLTTYHKALPNGYRITKTKRESLLMQFYQISVYQYDNQYKLVYFPRHVNEYADNLYFRSFDDEKSSMIGDRFSCNISRARSAVLGLSMCNDWQYFVTATLNKAKYDRFNLDAWRNDFSRWIRNQRQIHGHDFKYVLIPEQHDDGAWHMHGIVSGVPWDFLERFEYMKHPPKLVAKGYRYHAAMMEKFGFNSFGKIQNKAAVSRYILKYIAKGLGESDLNNGSHLFYASQKLNRPQVIKEGCSTCILTEVDFKNDYLASVWIDKAELDRISDYIL